MHLFLFCMNSKYFVSPYIFYKDQIKLIEIKPKFKVNDRVFSKDWRKYNPFYIVSIIDSTRIVIANDKIRAIVKKFMNESAREIIINEEKNLTLHGLS